MLVMVSAAEMRLNSARETGPSKLMMAAAVTQRVACMASVAAGAIHFGTHQTKQPVIPYMILCNWSCFLMDDILREATFCALIK